MVRGRPLRWPVLALCLALGLTTTVGAAHRAVSAPGAVTGHGAEPRLAGDLSPICRFRPAAGDGERQDEPPRACAFGLLATLPSLLPPGATLVVDLPRVAADPPPRVDRTWWHDHDAQGPRPRAPPAA